MNLEQFDKDFEQAEVKGGGTTEVDIPDGKYEMTIVDADCFESKDGRYFFKVQLRVESEGDSKGCLTTKLYGLDKPERFSFLKTDLFRMGISIQKVSQLPGMIEKIKGTLLNCVVKHKDQYQNVYINGVVRHNAEAGDSSVPF